MKCTVSLKFVSDILAKFVASISAQIHYVFLRGAYESENNFMTISDKSRCIRCTRLVKMPRISCFLETVKMFFGIKYFCNIM